MVLLLLLLLLLLLVLLLVVMCCVSCFSLLVFDVAVAAPVAIAVGLTAGGIQNVADHRV